MEKKQKRIVALGLLLVVLIVTAVVVVVILNKEYTLTFHGQGGTEHAQMNVSRNNRNETLLPEPIRPGWTFMGWTTTQSSQDYHPKTAERITGSTDLYAQWEPNNYVVNLYNDGERIDSLPLSLTEIRDGKFSFDQNWILDDQAIRTFRGWEFTEFTDASGLQKRTVQLIYTGSGWSISVDGGAAQAVSVDNPFRPSLYDNNVHALWNYKTATLVYLNEKGGTSSQNSKTVNFGSTVSLFQLQGAVPAIGWRIDSSKIKNTTLTVAATGSATSASKLSSAQLSKINGVLSATYSPGQEIYIDPLFTHLTTKVTTSGLVSTDTFEIYLYPVRFDSIFTSRFYYEGMTPILNERTGTEAGIWLADGGSNIVFRRPDDSEVVSYYYYENKNGTGIRTTINFNETYSTGPSGPFNQTHATVFYAERQIPQATINFDYGNSKLIRDLSIPDDEKAKNPSLNATAVQSIKKPIGSTFVLPSASMYAAFNKNFVGWQEVETNGTLGRIFPAGTEYTVRRDLAMANAERTYILKAFWMDSTVSVMFDLDGGYGFDSPKSADGVTITLPSKEAGPFKTGYRFLHWIVNNDVNNRIEAGETINLGDGVKVLKAVWEAEAVIVELRYTTRVGAADEQRRFTNAELGGNLKFGDVITLPAITDADYTGRYRHMGWTFETNGATYYTGTQVVLDDRIVNTEFYAVANSAEAEKGATVRFFNEFTFEGTQAAKSIGSLEFDLGKSVDILSFRDAYADKIPESMKETHTFEGFFIVPEGQETLSMHINTKEKYFNPANGAYGKRSIELPGTSSGELILFNDTDRMYELSSTSFSPITNFYMYLVPKTIEIFVNNQGTGVNSESIASYFGDQRDRANLASASSSKDTLGNWSARKDAINTAGQAAGNVFTGWEVEYLNKNNQIIGNKMVFPYSSSTGSFIVASNQSSLATEIMLMTNKLDAGKLPVSKIQVTPIRRNIHDFIVYIADDGTVSGEQGSIYRVHYKDVYSGACNNSSCTNPAHETNPNRVDFSTKNATVKSATYGLGANDGFLSLLSRSGHVIKNLKTKEGVNFPWTDATTFVNLGNSNEHNTQFNATDGSVLLYAEYSKINYTIRIVNEDPAAANPNFTVAGGATFTVGVGSFALLPTGMTSFVNWVNLHVEPNPGMTRKGYYIDRTSGALVFSLIDETERISGNINNGQFTAGANLTLNSSQFDLSRAVMTGPTSATLTFYVVWQRSNVTINYTSGTNLSFTQNFKYGDTNAVLNAPPPSWKVPAGKEFAGWKTKLANSDTIVIPAGVPVILGEVSSSSPKQLDVTRNSDGSAAFFSNNAYTVTLEAEWTSRKMGSITFDMKGDAGTNVKSLLMHSIYNYADANASVFTLPAGDYYWEDNLVVAVGGQFENTPINETPRRVFDGWYFTINGIEERADVDGIIALSNPLFVSENGSIRNLTFYAKWKEIDFKVFDLDISAGVVLNLDDSVPYDNDGNFIRTHIEGSTINASVQRKLEEKLGVLEIDAPTGSATYSLSDVHDAFGLDEADTIKLAFGYELVGFAIAKADATSASWHITTMDYPNKSYTTRLQIGNYREVIQKMTVIPIYKVVMITVEFNLGSLVPGATDRPTSTAQVRTVSNAATDNEGRTQRPKSGDADYIPTYQHYIKVPYNTLITLPYISSQSDSKFYVSHWQRTGVSPNAGAGGSVAILTENPYANKTVTFNAVWASASSLDNITLSLAVPKSGGGWEYLPIPGGAIQFYKKPDKAPIVALPNAAYQLPRESDSFISQFINDIINNPETASLMVGMQLRGWFMPNTGNNGPNLSNEIIDGLLVRPCNGEPTTDLTIYLVCQSVLGRVEFMPNNLNQEKAYMGNPGEPFNQIPQSEGGTGLWGVGRINGTGPGVDVSFGQDVPLILNPADGTNPIISPPTIPLAGWDLEFVGWTRYHSIHAPNLDWEKSVYNAERPFRLGYRYDPEHADANADGYVGEAFESGQTVILYAVWRPKVIEISFYVDGHLQNRSNELTIFNNGKGEYVDRSNETGLGQKIDGTLGGGMYYLNRQLGRLPVPVRTGYVFKEWTNNSGTITYSSSFVLDVASSAFANFYARFEPKIYTFAFDTGTTPSSWTPPANMVPAEVPFVNTGTNGVMTIILPAYASDFSRPGLEFAGWSHDGNFVIDTTLGNVTVQLGTENKMVNASYYIIDVGAETVTGPSNGKYLITFKARWGTETRMEVIYNTGGGTRTTDAVVMGYGYLFNDLRQPDKAGYTVGPASPDYMTYGIMIAEDYGYNPPAANTKQNFAGWKVISYDGKAPNEAGFPASLKNGADGKIFFPGDFLPGGLNQTVEFEAVWAPWTPVSQLCNGPTCTVHTQPTTISLGADSAYLDSDYFTREKLVFCENVQTIIVGRGFTRINQGAITAHNATRILLPTAGDLVLEPQAILAGGLEQIYISDNLRGGLIGRNNSDLDGITANVPNIVGGAILAPGQSAQIGGVTVTNTNAFNLIRSSMTHYLVKQGTPIFDFDTKAMTFTNGTAKYFYVEAANSNFAGVLMSRDRKDLIAYPGAAAVINIHDNIENIKGFAFSYMSATTSLTISGASLRNIEAYALFHSNIQNLNLPSTLNAGFLDAAAVSGYMPRLGSVNVNNLAHFTGGVLYHGTGEDSVMYITQAISATTGNATLSGGHLAINANVTSIAPYALSSMYVRASTGNKTVTSMEILGAGTRVVQASGMSSNPSGANAGRLDLSHFGTQSIAASALSSLELGNGIQAVDGRIFEGWELNGGLILNEGMHNRLDFAAQRNEPAADYNRFPVLVRTNSATVLDQFITGWSNWAVTNNSLLQDNCRVQALLKQVTFNVNNVGGAEALPNGTAINETIPGAKTVRYDGVLELPELTAPGYVLLGWKATTVGDANGSIFLPGWVRTVSMLNTDSSNYLTGTVYIQQQITLTAVWGVVQVEFMDANNKHINWNSLGARIVMNTETWVSTDPMTWQTRPATGYDFAGKKVKADGTPDLDANGDLQNAGSTVVFVLPGWNSGIIDGKAFVGWMRTNIAPGSRSWDSHAPSANRILPDGSKVLVHTTGVTDTFYALYDSASNNIIYEEIFPIGGFRNEVSAKSSGQSGAVRIPAAVYNSANGYMSAVTQITYAGFFQTSISAEVYIGSNVQVIDEFAFQGARMTNITFGINSDPDAPDIVIRNNAFHDTSMQSIVIPARVVSIGADAFSVGESLKSVTMSAGVSRLTTIGERAFWQCLGLETLFEIPAGVVRNTATGTGIGALAFARTSIKAFSKANNNPAVRNPNNYLTIDGNLCFVEPDGRTRLVNYAAGKAAEHIKADFFTGSNNIVLVGDYAFSYSKILSITIPNDPVQTLAAYARFGAYVFSWCRNLEYIAVQATTPSNWRELPNGAAVDILRDITYSNPKFYVGGTLTTWRNTFDYIQCSVDGKPQRFFAWGEKPV